MLWPRIRQQHGRAELSADYCVSNNATRVRLRLQAACFDIYAGGWRLEERELTSQSLSPLRSYLVRRVVNPQLIYFIYLSARRAKLFVIVSDPRSFPQSLK